MNLESGLNLGKSQGGIQRREKRGQVSMENCRWGEH